MAKTLNNLRQRTWGVFVKPYVMYKNRPHTVQGAVETTGICNGGDVPAQGGDPWMLNKVTTSFPEVREIVTSLMDMGILHEDIKVTEIIPTDFIITPLA